MKNYRIAIITAGVIIIAAVLAWLLYHQGEKQRDKMMVDFVTQSISSITGSWDPKELQERADPAFTRAVKASDKSLDDFFAMLRQLGAPKGDIACNRLRYSDITDVSGHYVTADFACKADFEHGPAVIVMQVKQENLRGPWRITLFRVDSPLFSKNKKDGKDEHDKQ